VARAARAAVVAIGAGVALLGAAVVVATVRPAPLRLDTLLFADAVARLPWRPPGRIAINTATAFVLLGVAVAALGLDGERRGARAARFARGAATLALLIAFLGIVGYVYGVQSLYRYGPLPGGMALVTAATVAVAALGAIAVRPSRGFVALLRGDDAGGLLARRLIPAAVIVPTGLGWLWLIGRRAEALERAGGVALFVIAMTVTFVLLVAASARTVRAYGAEREELLARERAARARAEEAMDAAEHATGLAESARAEAVQANRAKSEFLATMSHELRTPLNAIAGYAELLALGLRGPVTPEQAADLARIQRAERHLLGLVNDVLNLARVEAGRLDLRVDAVAVADVLREVEPLVGALVAQKRQRLTVADGDPTLGVRADREKLLQILLNLLSNAIKFTPEAGSIAVRAEPRGGDRVALTVADSGPGIPVDERERVFEPFVQLRAGGARTRGPAEGTGLGLAISRELARAMGGELEVGAGEGGGAALTLTLPRTEVRA
jgi:signal transduction histidine kinase